LSIREKERERKEKKEREKERKRERERERDTERERKREISGRLGKMMRKKRRKIRTADNKVVDEESITKQSAISECKRKFYF